MSVRLLLWTEVVCDECSDTTCGEYVSGGKRAMRPLLKALKAQGWVAVGHKVYCARCNYKAPK